jgi:hypothetical protein
MIITPRGAGCGALMIFIDDNCTYKAIDDKKMED